MAGSGDDPKEGPRRPAADGPQGSFLFPASKVDARKPAAPDPRPSPPSPGPPPLTVRRLAPERPQVEPVSATQVYKVSDIIGRAARLLDDNFASVWIEGEIEGFKRHQVSGNCYLALKDSGARVEAMLRRQVAQSVSFPLRDGLKVRVRGRLTIYKEQGRFQLYIEEMLLSGEGELLAQFEELKARLAREGLFDAARKRPLPRFPRVIGIATSQSGAALQDILKVATRRGRVRILIANCAVQGPQAPAQIAQAIDRLAPHVDVLIVGRGGGSVADLWGFNDEQVARAIHRCPVPVVSAVGHEVDFTIADFVADVRAPTPSAAAELCVPEYARLTRDLEELRRRLLRSGGRLIDGARQQLDGALGRSQLALERQLGQRRRQLDQLGQRLQARHPRTQLQRDQGALDKLHGRLLQSIDRQVANKRQALLATIGKLEAMSPLKVLTRGYAVARDESGRVLTDARTVAVGASLSVTLEHGVLFCKVESHQEHQDLGPQNSEVPQPSKN